MKIRLSHQSSRYDRSARSLLRAAIRLRRSHSIRTWTEVAEEHRAVVLSGDKEVGMRRGRGRRNADDCAVDWKRRSWALVDWGTDEIASHGGGMGKAPVSAVTVILEHRRRELTVLVTVAHLPRKVDQAAYDQCLHRWPNVVARYHHKHRVDATVVVADWNRDHRDQAVRATLRRCFGLGSIWAGRNPSRGTHGSRLIDAALTDLHVARAVVLPDNGSSDHRPISYTLTATAPRRNHP